MNCQTQLSFKQSIQANADLKNSGLISGIDFFFFLIIIICTNTDLHTESE